MMSPIEIRDRHFPSTPCLLCLASFFLLFLAGCLPKRVHYEIPPSHHALTGISQLHVDEFAGQNALFFKDILIQEIYKIPNFDYQEIYPTGSEYAAIITSKVMVYSVRNEKELRDQNRVKLIQRDIVQRPKGSSERIRKRIFDFVEVPYKERAVHRTLDLNISFTVTSAKTNKILYKNTEKVSFQQSYIDEEEILLMPLSQDEMERLGRLLIRRFLEKINPSLSRKSLELEIGTAPLPLSLGMADVGHPRILNGNRYAVIQDYEKAIKIWNYVVFSPQPFASEEIFEFNDRVFAQLKSAKLPPRIIQSLLELHNDSFSLEELNEILPKLIGQRNYLIYSTIIKTHARAAKNRDRLNLAAAHYNLGSVYQLQNKLSLAAYHFAQANAYNPNEKYAQAWTDVQHELGDYNPLDTLMDRTIEAASKQLPPSEALVKVEKRLAGLEEGSDNKKDYPELKPTELPILFEENRDTSASSQQTPSPVLDLD
ncbi:MAG: hypothetical protein HQM14_01880 [SAR324 cluster bacterium]|nr:hypothetical protein [SAR324 cluster bacterium]